MRYFRTLSENKKQYQQMLASLVQQGVLSSDDQNTVLTQVRAGLKRQDRIVWWLRWYRLMKSDQVWQDQTRKNPGSEAEWTRWYRKVNGLGQNDQTDAHQIRSFRQNFTIGSANWDHTVDMIGKSTDMDRVQWSVELSPVKLQMKLRQAEKIWAEKQDQLVKPEADDRIVIQYENSAWWLLPRPSCDAEGKAMGHCGNTASPKKGDRILSYRTRTKAGEWRPSLTFVLHANGTLGEMKGRANEKPNPKYHPVIVDLLVNPMVKGITGGGWDADNNFAVMDLDGKNLRQLIAARPEFTPDAPRSSWRDDKVNMPADLQPVLLKHDPGWLFSIKNLVPELRKKRRDDTYAIVTEPGLTDLYYQQRLTQAEYQQALDDNGEDSFVVARRRDDK